MRITVVIPCYNAERYVAMAIRSVQMQTFRNWRLIVVDDGSTDGSWAQVQYYKKRPRKEILEEAEKLFQKSPEIYCTRQGKMLTKGILSVWVREWQMS